VGVAEVLPLVAERLGAIRGEESERGEPVYRRLVAALRRSIEDGALPLGARLPSERRLSSALGLSRTTVQTAYRELEALGYVESRRGSGTYVCGRPEWPSQPRASAIPKHTFARRAKAAGNTFLLDLMHAASTLHRYAFETGMPDPRLMPVRAFHAIIEDLFSQRSAEWVSYSPTQGVPQLRQALTHTLLPLRGLHGVRPEEVLITTGSLQGLDLVSKLFLEPGDTVLVEEPSFPGATQIFRSFGAELVGVPVDEEGLVVDHLQEVLARVKPKLLYVQPTLQNPTGAVLSARRRARLLDVASRWRTPIVEDDAYGLLLGQDAPPALKARDEEGLVIYLGTVSKILSPGLRVGYLVADEGLVRALSHVKQLTDLHTSTVSQFLVEGWLTTADVRGHLRTCQRVYGERLRLALDCLRRHPLIEPYIEPQGGIYVFGRILTGIQAARLRVESAERGVIFAPGDAFAVAGGLQDCLRLCVGASDLAALRVGLGRLLRLVEELQTPA
jgi:2-aminoadipate transaminase